MPDGFVPLGADASSRLLAALEASKGGGNGPAFCAGSERVEVGAGRAVAIFAVDGELLAIDADCPHQGAGLEAGDIEDGGASVGPCVSCPRHGWLLELRTGFCEDLGDVGVGTYEVRTLGSAAAGLGPEAKPTAVCVAATPRSAAPSLT